LHAANAVVFYAVARRLLAAGFSVGPAERAMAWGAAAAARQGATVTGCAAYGLGARVAMTLYSLMFYPSKFLWPVELSPMYELPARVEPLAWRFLLPMVAVPAVTAALLLLRRRWPGGRGVGLFGALAAAGEQSGACRVPAGPRPVQLSLGVGSRC